jgi:hypothetical protein
MIQIKEIVNSVFNSIERLEHESSERPLVVLWLYVLAEVVF